MSGSESVAIITGAAQGVGEGIAREFAKNAYRIVIADIDEANAHSTAKLIEGAEATAIGCDITDRRSVESIVVGERHNTSRRRLSSSSLQIAIAHTHHRYPRLKCLLALSKNTFCFISSVMVAPRTCPTWGARSR